MHGKRNKQNDRQYKTKRREKRVPYPCSGKEKELSEKELERYYLSKYEYYL